LEDDEFGLEMLESVSIGYELGEKFMFMLNDNPAENVIDMHGKPIKEDFFVPELNDEDEIKGFNAAIHDHLQVEDDFDYLKLFLFIKNAG